MTTMVYVYVGYLAVCILVTWFVARTLRIHGTVYMTERSSEGSALIKAKTHLMVVGFYLITLGTVGFALRYGGEATDAKTAIEILSAKLGGVIFLIGFFHFVMLALFVNEGARKRNDIVLAKPVKLPNA